MYPTSPYLQKYKSLVEGADQQVYQRIFYDGERIANHKRSRKAGAYTTIGTHMPSAPQAYNDLNHDSFARLAVGIGSYAVSYIRGLIVQYDYPEIGYKQAQGILALAKQYSAERARES